MTMYRSYPKGLYVMMIYTSNSSGSGMYPTAMLVKNTPTHLFLNLKQYTGPFSIFMNDANEVYEYAYHRKVASLRHTPTHGWWFRRKHFPYIGHLLPTYIDYYNYNWDNHRHRAIFLKKKGPPHGVHTESNATNLDKNDINHQRIKQRRQRRRRSWWNLIVYHWYRERMA